MLLPVVMPLNVSPFKLRLDIWGTRGPVGPFLIALYVHKIASFPFFPFSSSMYMLFIALGIGVELAFLKTPC